MSEGSVFQCKDKKWCGKWKDADGKTKYLYRKTKAEAKQALRAVLADRDNNIVPADKLTLNDALEQWLEDQKDSVSLRTWGNRKSLVRNHIRTHAIGSRKLHKLTADDLRGFSARRAASSPGTVGLRHAAIKMACEKQARKRTIRTNPASEVKPPPAWAR